MSAFKKQIMLPSLFTSLVCSSVLAADLNVSVTSGGSGSVTVVPCGGIVPYEIRAILSDWDNEGLAGFLLDLEFDGGPLEPADQPADDPMQNFVRPAGMSGAAGFGGEVVDGRLIKVGGAQNTINNTPDIAPFPIGSVITGVAHTEQVLVTGTLTAPVEAGTYVLKTSRLKAAVIKEGEDGTDFWATERADVGTVTNLTVVVPPASPPTTAANNGPVCQDEAVTLLGGPDGMTTYSWSGPGGFVSSEQNPVVSLAVPGTYTLTVTDANNCMGAARTTVVVVPLSCQQWADCNENGIHDECDIVCGTSEDANQNWIPDECEQDCNENGLLDECDLDCGEPGGPCDLPGCGVSLDCNANDKPDECDIAEGTAEDFDGDLILDICDPDIDDDGVLNETDVCDYTPLGEAVNPSGGPMGDLDDDCEVTLGDYLYFQICLSLSGPGGYPGFPACRNVFDFDDDEDVDLGDFSGFQRAHDIP